MTQSDLTQERGGGGRRRRRREEEEGGGGRRRRRKEEEEGGGGGRRRKRTEEEEGGGGGRPTTETLITGIDVQNGTLGSPGSSQVNRKQSNHPEAVDSASYTIYSDAYHNTKYINMYEDYKHYYCNIRNIE